MTIFLKQDQIKIISTKATNKVMTLSRNFLFKLTLIYIAISFSTPLLAENVPREIGGIALGTNIDSYTDIVQSNFMKEVVVTDRHGFRKGVISYGVCKYEGEILQIKLKYKDKSKGFYKVLLKKFKQKYGEPDDWNGDSFGLLHIWKWYFVDKDKNRVSLNLQHNTKDPNETIGNVVKLSYPDRIIEERLCFMQMCDMANRSNTKIEKSKTKKNDWLYLIPR